jgi:hypothetical protein
MTWLIGLLSSLAGILLKLWQGRGPAPIVVEGEKAGAAESALQTEKDANVEITKSAEAGAAVDQRIATDDGLRKYEQSDPNNRANNRP